jgi:multiple sugar transport system substrate-binding protein
MKRRNLMISAAALAVSMGVTAAPALASEGVTVLLPPWGSLTKEMTDKFTADTGIAIEMQTLGWDEIRTKVVTTMMAGSAPGDANEFDWGWVGQFGSAGWYTDLNGKVDAAMIEDIPTSAIFAYDGALLGVPYNNDFRVMLYNKAHLDAAGVALPVTMDELWDAAVAVKASGAAEYPIGLPLSATEGASTAWYLLTKAFDGDLFDADFNPLFTDPNSAGYKAMAFEINAVKEGLIDPAATGLADVEVQELFKAGKVTFDLAGWPGMLAVYSDPSKSQVADHAHAGLVPNVSGQSRSFGLVEAVGVPSTAENPEAAFAFINWMMSPEVARANYDTLGLMPTRQSVLNELAASGELKDGDVIAEQAGYAEPLFAQGTPSWYPEFSSAVNENINAAAKGQITVDEAVEAIASAVEDAK